MNEKLKKIRKNFLNKIKIFLNFYNNNLNKTTKLKFKNLKI